MNKEMMYQMFLNSLKNMSEEEIKCSLNRVRGMLSDEDYKKLETLIEIEKKNKA